MIDSYLLKTFEKYLGINHGDTKGNVAFTCPFKHHRRGQLIIQLDPNLDSFGYWHCWACPNASASGKHLESLLKKINVNDAIVKEIKRYIEVEIHKTSHYTTEDESIKSQLFLPSEFLPLYKKNNTPEYKNALYYLIKKRKLTVYEILRYNIGYCENGRYRNRVIIPSYDEFGNLNFFTGRSFITDEYKKYLGPYLSEKDFIGFDLFINWNYPIAIFEGPFDAIAFRRNAIPLFGKIIPNSLKLKIIKHKVKDIYLGLDPDAIKDSINYIEDFLNEGINVHLLTFPEKDAAEVGYPRLMQIAKDSQIIKFSDLMKLKLQRL